MNIQINAVRFDADSKLVNHVNKRLEKLTNFHDRIVSVEIYLKLDNIAHQIKDKIAEIRVRIPRHDSVGRHESKSFEESFDLAFDSLVAQLKKQKERKIQ